MLPVRRLLQPAGYGSEPRLFVVVVDHFLDVVAHVVDVVDVDALPVATVGKVAGNRRESPTLTPAKYRPLHRRGMTPYPSALAPVDVSTTAARRSWSLSTLPAQVHGIRDRTQRTLVNTHQSQGRAAQREGQAESWSQTHYAQGESARHTGERGKVRAGNSDRPGEHRGRHRGYRRFCRRSYLCQRDVRGLGDSGR